MLHLSCFALWVLYHTGAFTIHQYIITSSLEPLKYMFSHLTAIEIFIPFNAQQKYLLSDGRISVCLLCFQSRKWTDLQSAEGHKDAAHTCDDVKVKGSEMALTKSRAAVAQWELKMNREMELNPGSCFIVWNVFFSLTAGQCCLLVCCPCIPSCSLWKVHLAKPAERYRLLWKGSQHTPSTNRTRYSTLCHCNKQGHIMSWN